MYFKISKWQVRGGASNWFQTILNMKWGQVLKNFTSISRHKLDILGLILDKNLAMNQISTLDSFALYKQKEHIICAYIHGKK
jgi:hypothetical protein